MRSLPVIVLEQDSETILTAQSLQNGTSHPTGEPTTLSWVGQTGVIMGNVVEPPPDYSSTLEPEESREPSSQDHVPQDRIPQNRVSQDRVSRDRTPTEAVIYTFIQEESDTMHLVPPDEFLDSLAIYHILVKVNPFIPTSSTTTVRRDGAHVADFEWGLMQLPSMVSIGNAQVESSKVLKFHPSPISGRMNVKIETKITEYTWLWPDDEEHALFWSCKDHQAMCFWQVGPLRPNLNRALPVAVFSGRVNDPPMDRRRQPSCTLKVYPSAFLGGLLDYIVVGALMIERKRLSPWYPYTEQFIPGYFETSAKWIPKH